MSRGVAIIIRAPCLRCQGGSIASYATDNAALKVPFWQMVFKNVRLFVLGSDDFPREAKTQGSAANAQAFQPRDFLTSSLRRVRQTSQHSQVASQAPDKFPSAEAGCLEQ